MTVAKLIEYILVFSLVLISGLGMGLGMSASQRHHELSIGLDTGVPSSCAALSKGHGDSCKGALTSEAGKVLGVPIANWGMATMGIAFAAALVFAGALSVGAWQVAAHVFSLLVLLALIDLGGTLTYLYIGLIQMGTKCAMCLAMHTANAAFCLVVGLAWTNMGDRMRDLARTQGPAWKRQVAATVALGVGFWFIVSVGTDFYFTEQQRRLHKKRTDGAELIRERGEVMLACPAKDCMASLQYATADLPPDDASLVLAKAAPGRQTLVEMLDMSCPHCRHEYKERMSMLYHRLLAAPDGTGARLLLWPASNECNPEYGGQKLPNCEANAALVCAWQAGPDQGLAYADEEASHAHEQVTFDRPAWLKSKAGAAAEQCFQREVSAGFPTLKRHVQAAVKLREVARGKSAECRTGLDAGGKQIDAGVLYWCFTGTPSYAVFGDRGSAPGPDQRLQAAQAFDKWPFLAGCLK